MFEHSSRVKGFAAGFGFLRETEFYLLENSKKLLIYTIVAVCMCNKLYLFRKRIVRVIRRKVIVSFLFCLLLFSGCGPDADGGNEVPDTENTKAVF